MILYHTFNRLGLMIDYRNAFNCNFGYLKFTLNNEINRYYFIEFFKIFIVF